jgi:hypothetical protein
VAQTEEGPRTKLTLSHVVSDMDLTSYYSNCSLGPGRYRKKNIRQIIINGGAMEPIYGG